MYIITLNFSKDEEMSDLMVRASILTEYSPTHFVYKWESGLQSFLRTTMAAESQRSTAAWACRVQVG